MSGRWTTRSPAARPAGGEVADPPLDRWEGESADELARRWALPEVHLFASVGSTNDRARALAAAGAPPGALVLAEEQRSGRGRAGRSWASPAGLGLWVSAVYRPREMDALGVLPLRVGLAAARALDPWAAPNGVQVKWPNDLRIEDRKLGGILCEAAWDGARLDHVVVGIGLNVLQRAADFPEPIRHRATSLRLVAAKPPSRLAVADALIAELRLVLAGPAALDGMLEAELARRDALRGRELEVLEPESGRRIAAGRGAGISREGALRLETTEGVREIRTGSVRLAGEGADG